MGEKRIEDDYKVCGKHNWGWRIILLDRKTGGRVILEESA